MMSLDEVVTYVTIRLSEIKPTDLAEKATMLLFEFTLCSPY